MLALCFYVKLRKTRVYNVVLEVKQRWGFLCTIHLYPIIISSGPSKHLVGAVSYSPQLLGKSELGEGRNKREKPTSAHHRHTWDGAWVISLTSTCFSSDQSRECGGQRQCEGTSQNSQVRCSGRVPTMLKENYSWGSRNFLVFFKNPKLKIIIRLLWVYFHINY